MVRHSLYYSFLHLGLSWSVFTLRSATPRQEKTRMYFASTATPPILQLDYNLLILVWNLAFINVGLTEPNRKTCMKQKTRILFWLFSQLKVKNLRPVHLNEEGVEMCSLLFMNPTELHLPKLWLSNVRVADPAITAKWRRCSISLKRWLMVTKMFRKWCTFTENWW